jgi:ABC-type bacteriocin/lantibiotic exporter with double-glycine peptidase domain
MIDKPVSYDELKDTLTAEMRRHKSKGTSLLTLTGLCEEYGIVPVVIHFDPSDFSLLPGPAIVHVKHLENEPEGSHYRLFLGDYRNELIAFMDPPQPTTIISRTEFGKLCTGYALIPFASDAEAERFRTRLREHNRTKWEHPVSLALLVSELAIAGGLLLRRSSILSRAVARNRG